MRRPLLALATLVAAAAGFAGASVVSAGPPPPAPLSLDEVTTALSSAIGDPVADPGGGPSWAVRVSTSATGMRCLMVGRTDGRSFGPLGASGRILDVPPSLSGSCAKSGAEPLQVALARYAATATTQARTVLFGVADARVQQVAVTEPEAVDAIALDGDHTFLVVREGLSQEVTWRVVATLDDGTQRTYLL